MEVTRLKMGWYSILAEKRRRLLAKVYPSKPRPELFIVSHPKCGRTWLNVMVSKVLNEVYDLNADRNFSLLDLTRRIQTEKDPNIRIAMFDHDTSCFRKAHRFSYLKHDHKKTYANAHVMLLVRDPRDVLVSSYHQIVSRDKNAHEIEEDISKFLRSESYGIRKIVEFYKSWERNTQIPSSFTLIRYEDMIQDPKAALRGALEQMNISGATDDAIARAVQASTFDKMQKMEREHAFDAGAMAHIGNDNVNAMKARKGKAGGFVEELSAEDVQFLNDFVSLHGCPFYARSELARAVSDH